MYHFANPAMITEKPTNLPVTYSARDGLAMQNISKIKNVESFGSGLNPEVEKCKFEKLKKLKCPPLSRLHSQ